MREPRRAALGALYAIFGEAALAMTDLCPVAAFAPAERQVFATMLARGVNSPLTSSVGPAVRCRRSDPRFLPEGQLRRASGDGGRVCRRPCRERQACSRRQPYPTNMVRLWSTGGRCWRRWCRQAARASRPRIRRQRFTKLLSRPSSPWRRASVSRRVLLTGGCFQNARLTERTVGAAARGRLRALLASSRSAQ